MNKDRKEYLKQYRLSHKDKYREYNKKYKETHLTTYQKLKQQNKELHNKIDKLSNENQSLRTRIKTIKRRRKHQTQKLNKYKTVVTDLRNALEKKNNKIDKAIEYIKEKVEEDEKCTDIKFLNFGEGVDYDLLKILKGDVDE